MTTSKGSVHPANGQAAKPNGVKAVEERQTAWTSLYIASSLGLISATQLTIYFASQWPFMKVLDPTVTEFFYGAVVASYALAQCIFGPLLGLWSNRIGQLRWPLITCSGFMTAGNVIYATVELLPSHKNWGLLVARFITGIGGSNMGLLMVGGVFKNW